MRNPFAEVLNHFRDPENHDMVITFESDTVITEWQLRLVPSTASHHAQGQRVKGEMIPRVRLWWWKLLRKEKTIMTVRVPNKLFQQHIDQDGAYTAKVFVKDVFGRWSS
jgi:hypothetical protein